MLFIIQMAQGQVHVSIHLMICPKKISGFKTHFVKASAIYFS